MNNTITDNYIQVLETNTERFMDKVQTDVGVGSGECRVEHKTKYHCYYFYGNDEKEAVERKETFLKECEKQGLNLDGSATDNLPEFPTFPEYKTTYRASSNKVNANELLSLLKKDGWHISDGDGYRAMKKK